MGKEYTNHIIKVRGTTGFCATQRPYKNKYKLELFYEGAAAKKVFKQLSDIYKAEQEEYGKNKLKKPFAWEVDEDSGERTGRLRVAFSQTASGKYRTGDRAGEEWTAKKIRHLDTAGNTVQTLMGAGSEVHVKFYTRTAEYEGKHFLIFAPITVLILSMVAYVPEQENDDDMLDEDIEGYIEGDGLLDDEDDEEEEDGDDWDADDIPL